MLWHKWVNRILTVMALCGFIARVMEVPSRGLTTQAVSEVGERVGKLLEAGKAREAESVSTRHLSQSPPDPGAYLEMGRVYFQHEQWERAAGLFRKSLELQAHNDTAHLLLGLSLVELKQPEGAERELLLAVEQDPRSETNCFMAGRQLLMRGKFEASLPYFYKAVELNPSSVRAYQGLAAALARTGSYAMAVNYYEKAITIAEKDHSISTEPLLNASYLLLLSTQKESSQRALEHAREALRLDLNSQEGHYLCGKALLNLGRYAEARDELVVAAELNPRDARTFFLLAQAHDRLGDPARARAARKTFAQLSKQRTDEVQPLR